MADDVHELSALYALDALDEDERSRFESHLEECARCRHELASWRDAAVSLAYAAEAPVPPVGLRDRILVSARSERQNVVPLRPRRKWLAPAAAAVAVAATAAAVGIGIWAASLNGSLSKDRSALRVFADPTARHIPLSGVTGTLVVTRGGVAALAANLPSPPSGKQYEAWVIDSATHRAGVFSGRTTTLTTRVHAGATVKVTLERAGGVDAPTTTPLLSARV
jgi:anti-sigma-K factor RskA